MFPTTGKFLKSIAVMFTIVGIVFALILGILAMCSVSYDHGVDSSMPIIMGFFEMILSIGAIWVAGYVIYTIGIISENTEKNPDISVSPVSDMYCPLCGAKIPSDSVFCPECGKQIK